MERRSHDLGDAVGRRRLDELPPAPGQQRCPDPVLPTLGLGHVDGQPESELVGVSHAALSEAGVVADLAAMALGSTAEQLIGIELGGRHAHLAAEVGHSVVGYLMAASREPASPQEEFQEHGEAETRGAGLVA